MDGDSFTFDTFGVHLLCRDARLTFLEGMSGMEPARNFVSYPGGEEERTIECVMKKRHCALMDMTGDISSCIAHGHPKNIDNPRNGPRHSGCLRVRLKRGSSIYPNPWNE